MGKSNAAEEEKTTERESSISASHRIMGVLDGDAEALLHPWFVRQPSDLTHYCWHTAFVVESKTLKNMGYNKDCGYDERLFDISCIGELLRTMLAELESGEFEHFEVTNLIKASLDSSADVPKRVRRALG